MRLAYVYPKCVRDASLALTKSDKDLTLALESAYDEGYELGLIRGEESASHEEAQETEQAWEAATKTFDNWFKHVYVEQGQSQSNLCLDLCEMLHVACNSPYLVNKMLDELSFVFGKKIGFIE